MLILGIDPGLNNTGWGVVRQEGNSLSFVAGGTLKVPATLPMPERLKQIYVGLQGLLVQYQPQAAAIEEVFVNSNPRTSLKLGQARGVAMLTTAMAGLTCAEYTPSEIKKALVGTGRADKNQVSYMIKVLLPRAVVTSPDMGDALAVAVCHAHTSLGGMPRR